jgi:hypothetical protein
MLNFRSALQRDHENGFEKARIIINRKANVPYLIGAKGYIVKLHNTTAECRINIDGHMNTLFLNTQQFFLEYPEDYSPLPTINTLRSKKRGGEFIMGKMPWPLKWVAWLAVVYILWDFATHVNLIVSFLAHVFLHR